MCHDSTWSPSSLAQKFLLVQSSFNQYTAIIMGKTSKNQNYFLISAVILGNILTCFTKPYNYPDSLFKTLFFFLFKTLLFVYSTPAIQMLMQDQSHGQLMKTQTKTSRRQGKLSNHHEEEETGGQTISALLLLSRVESAHLHLPGSPSPTSKRRGAHAGRLEPSSGASFGIKLLQHPASGCSQGDKGFPHHVLSLQGGVQGLRARAWLWAATGTQPLPSGSHTEGLCRL